jgi:hypothetical protein
MADNKQLVYNIKITEDGTFIIKELNVETKDAAVAFQALNKSIRENAKESKLTASALQAQINQLKKLRNANTTNNNLFRKQTEDIRLLENEYKKLTLVTQQQTDKTGLASATLVEFSRGVQDANYGFRGVANNLSQLTTLMTTLIGTTGGLKNAWVALKDAFTGPIGFLVVANIVIAALERLEIMSQKTTKTTDEMTDALADADGLTASLKRYADIAEDATKTDDERTVALQRLKDDGYDPLIGSLEDFLDAKRQISLFNATEKILQGEEKDFLVELIQLQRDLTAQTKAAAEPQPAFTPFRGTGITSATVAEEEMKKTKGLIEENKENLIRVNDEIVDAFEKVKADLEENPFFQILFGVKGDKEDKTKKIKEEADITTDILKEFLYGLDELDLEGISFLDASEVAFNERAEYLKQFQIQSATDRINLAEDNAIKELDLLYQDLDNRIGYEEDLTRITEFYANERIKVGDKESEARQRSIREIGRAVSSVGKLLQDVAGENKNLAVAGVIIEKAGAIAQIISNTAIANAKAVAAFPVTAGQPFVGINTASAGVSIASTIAQASKAVSEIKNPSSASSGGGATAALPSTQIQAPAFNVVGATQESQLAQTISQAEQQPIKAFVVASDVSTAQELERSTIEGASIG